MQETPQGGVSRRVVQGFIVVSGVLAVIAMAQLIINWQAWRSGASDLYPSQHAWLVASSARGVLLALVLPIPLLLSRATRRKRRVVFAVWGVVMLGWGALWMWPR